MIDPEKPILGPFRNEPPRSPETLTVRERTTTDSLKTYVYSVPQETRIDNKCQLINETLTISPINGKLFNISNTPSPNTLLIAVNGITLSESDYTISADTIINLTQSLDPNRDIITASYLDCEIDLDTIYSEQYQVLSAVTSGVTSAVTTTDKVYYNTEQNKYEYYLDYNPADADTTMMFFLNGIKLTYGVDFYMSISVENRVILDGINLSLSDIIYVVYT